MRITIVGINYTPEATGIAPYTTGLAEGLVDRGHAVEVLSGLPHYPEWRVSAPFQVAGNVSEVINGVRIRRLHHHVPSVPDVRGRIALEASFARAVLSSRLAAPDVVVAVSPSLLAAGATVLKSRHTPVGVIVHDLYGQGVVETAAMDGPAARAVRHAESAVLRNATGVNVIHDKFVPHALAAGVDPHRLSVIKNWVHIGSTNQARTRDAVRRGLGWHADETVVLHAGNIGVKQGLENVVAAARAADCALGMPRLKFVLLGDGNQRARLQDEAGKIANLQFLRLLPYQQFRAALDAADILLVNEKPGLAEMAVPSKLTSYFAARKPIIAATDGNSATANEIRDARAGVVVAPGNPGELVRAIRTLSRDEKLQNRLAAAGERYAQRNLTATSAIDKYESWIDRLAFSVPVCRAAKYEPIGGAVSA